MSEVFTLRNKIAEQRNDYEKRNMMEYWEDEGMLFAIMDYSFSKGSVMDFSEDDWRVCKECGFSIHEVCECCGEEHFSPNVDNLEEFLRLYLEAWEHEDMPGEQMAATIQSYFRWRGTLLPKAEKIYSNS